MILKKGIIKDGLKTIYDAKDKNFGVPVQSKSFSGIVDLKELKEHLFTSKIDNSATPYNWSGLYRSKKPSWGFCMSLNDLKKFKWTQLDSTEYEKIIKRINAWCIKNKKKMWEIEDYWSPVR